MYICANCFFCTLVPVCWNLTEILICYVINRTNDSPVFCRIYFQSYSFSNNTSRSRSTSSPTNNSHKPSPWTILRFIYTPKNLWIITERNAIYWNKRLLLLCLLHDSPFVDVSHLRNECHRTTRFQLPRFSSTSQIHVTSYGCSATVAPREAAPRPRISQ